MGRAAFCSACLRSFRRTLAQKRAPVPGFLCWDSSFTPTKLCDLIGYPAALPLHLSSSWRTPFIPASSIWRPQAVWNYLINPIAKVEITWGYQSSVALAILQVLRRMRFVATIVKNTGKHVYCKTGRLSVFGAIMRSGYII